MRIASKHFTICLPTKPFLKKFLEAKFGSPIQFGLDDFFGMVIASVMDKNVYPNRSHKEIKVNFDKYDVEAKIFLPFCWLKYYRYGNGVEPKKAVFINKMLEHSFENELYTYVRMHTKKDIRYRGYIPAYESFAQLYNLVIDEDITLENLQKTEYRFRKKIEKNNESKKGIQAPIIIANTLF